MRPADLLGTAGRHGICIERHRADGTHGAADRPLAGFFEPAHTISFLGRICAVSLNRDKAILAAVLLERVARGELEAAVALNEWPQDQERDPLLGASWHDLSHFAADGDIRTKDQRYRTYQQSLLFDRAKRIREMFQA